jgi:hypothetical protein
LAEFSKGGFRPRLQQPELRFRKLHLLTNLSLRLFIKIEASENFTISLGEFAQDRFHDFDLFMKGDGLLRVSAAIGYRAFHFDIALFVPAVNKLTDMPGDLSTDHRPNKSHQAFWFAQVPALDSLHDDYEGLVEFVFHFMANPAANEKPNAVRKDLEEFLHRRMLLAGNARYKGFKIRARDCIVSLQRTGGVSRFNRLRARL